MIAVQEGGKHDGSEDGGRMTQAAGLLQAPEEACCGQAQTDSSSERLNDLSKFPQPARGRNRNLSSAC